MTQRRLSAAEQTRLLQNIDVRSSRNLDRDPSDRSLPWARDDKHSDSDDPDAVVDDNTKGELWLRTLMVALLWTIVTIGCVIAALYRSILYCAVLAVACPVVFEFLAPVACGSCYTNRRGEKWKRTVRRVVLIAVFFTVIASASGGYYLRQWYVPIASGSARPSFETADASALPHPKFGMIHRFSGPNGVGNAIVEPAHGGRMLAFGFIPTCVAPILVNKNDKRASYWAIGHGLCCTKQPMNCHGWSSTGPIGGVWIKYRELYPELGTALMDSYINGGMHFSSNHSLDQIVAVGDVPNLLKTWATKGFVIFGALYIFGLFVAAYSAMTRNY